jgi:hypothetical protein
MAKLSKELQSSSFEEEKHENVTLADILYISWREDF